MRKVTFGVANSLDNYIARPDAAVDWLLWSKEVNEIMREFWKSIDTVLMGRKTYEVALGHSKGKKNPYPGVKSYVFSRTLKDSKDASVEIVREDASSFVRKLKGEAGKDICVMGGGEFAKSLFEARLIDEIGVNIHPVLLGQGIPLFHEMNLQLDLELLDCKTLKTGCVVLSYRVKN
ncbi:MAG TPA: dihydrofolate reductase family protein [Pyrinomonadaceae bacterium]